MANITIGSSGVTIDLYVADVHSGYIGPDNSLHYSEEIFGFGDPLDFDGERIVYDQLNIDKETAREFIQRFTNVPNLSLNMLKQISTYN